ncbi:MAG: LCP family protein [Fimbriimonadaceae bacterium]
MPKRSKKHVRWRSAIAWLFYGLLCAAALGAGAAAQWVGRSPIMVSMIQQTLTSTKPTDVFATDTLTLLVLGCDEDRAPGGRRIVRQQARSDMMLIVKIDFKRNRVGGISIPRDLGVDLPGYRFQKINAFHAIGGKDLAREAAEFVTGIPIDRVIVLDYQAFSDMVDLVGGVDVFVGKRMKYTDRRGDLFIDLQPGRQRLSGRQAVGFVRYRHSDSDFERIKRQRDFVLAFKEALLAKPEQLPMVINKASELLGGDLRPDQLASLARFLQSVPSDSVKLGSVPVREGRGTYLELDRERLATALREYYLLPGDLAASRSPL